MTLPAASSPRMKAAGTPMYMAPEVWRGEPATRRSDLYSLGILLYELLAGTAPHRGIPLAELGNAVQTRDIPRLGSVVPSIEPTLAAIVDRLVEREPSARFASADALLVALEEVAALPTRAALPDGNPYRGLAAFGSAHGALFFGRQSEIHELVDRVRIEPFVVVGGDSGTGKSSLCRAGALPFLAEHDGWSCVDVIPGPPPRALARGRAGRAGSASTRSSSSRSCARPPRRSPARSARSTRGRAGAPAAPVRGSARGAAHAVGAGGGAGGGRRARRRSRCARRRCACWRAAGPTSSRAWPTLPGLGDEMARGLYFLAPLTGERIREVIVRPAAAKGVAFESEELIDALVEQTEHAPGGLPLLAVHARRAVGHARRRGAS